MHTSEWIYHHGEQKLQGFLAYEDKYAKSRPGVLVAHDWSGCNDFAREKATMLAEMGYVGLALDMYGDGKTGETTEEKMALLQPFKSDRRLLASRIRAAFDALSDVPEVDTSRIAAIGFCFGGMCVLDLARSGAALRGVVSFHGLLDKPEHLANASVKAKILVLNGYDDPMATPDSVNAFSQEMTAAKVDWQVHNYGLTKHSFTNPQAHDIASGLVYNARAEKRALQSMTDFLNEILPSYTTG